MLHPMGRLLVYRLYAMGFIISALGITCTASTAALSYKKVQFWFGAFSLLQFMVVCQMAYIGAAPAVHSYLDWATNLTTLVPQMLVLDLSSTKLALFLLLHAGAETAFYLSVVAHSFPVALIRAACLYSVVAIVFLCFRRAAYAAYLTLRVQVLPEGSQNLPLKQAEAPLPSKQHECMEMRHRVQEEEAAPIPTPPIHAYRSRMRQKRVTVTINTPLALSQVPEVCIKDLLHEVGSCWNSHVTDVCVRSGCIVVSLNIWEPLQSVGGLAQQPLANLHRTLVDVAGAWVAKYNLGSSDSAAPTVSVQVSDLVSSITKSPRSPGLPTAAAPAYPDPNPASGSPSLPRCMLSMPSPALLVPPFEPADPERELSLPITTSSIKTESADSGSPSAGPSSNKTMEEAAPVLHKHTAEGAMSAKGAMTVVSAHTARVKVPFEVFIRPSMDLGDVKVLGWAKEEDSPEEDGPGYMRLLACVAGQFMPLRVLRHEKQGCRHFVQVSMSLPASMSTTCAGSLTLELWMGTLMCCHTTLLLPYSCAPICKELHDWAASVGIQQQQQPQQEVLQQQYVHSFDDSHFGNGQQPLEVDADTGVLDVDGFHAFVSDLGEWLQFVGRWRSCAAAATDAEGQLGGVVGESLIAGGEERLQIMAAVGKDLLFSSVRFGMASLAGMLLKCLMMPPFSLPFTPLATNIPESVQPTPEPATRTYTRSPSTTDSSSVGSLDGNTRDELLTLGCAHAESQDATESARFPPENNNSVSAHSPHSAHSRSVIAHSAHSTHSTGGARSDVRVSKCKVMLVEAALSGNTAMLQQVLAWGRALGGPGFAWPWEASDCSASVLMAVLRADASKKEVLQVLMADPTEGGWLTRGGGPEASRPPFAPGVSASAAAGVTGAATVVAASAAVAAAGAATGAEASAAALTAASAAAGMAGAATVASAAALTAATAAAGTAGQATMTALEAATATATAGAATVASAAALTAATAAAGIAGQATTTALEAATATATAGAFQTSMAAAATATVAGEKVSQAGEIIAEALGSDVKEKKTAQEEWRQAQQADSVALRAARAHDFPSYSMWLLARYRKLTTQWALMFCVIVLSHVLHPVAAPVTESVILNFNMMMILAAAAVAVANQRGAYSMVKFFMFMFWIFQVLTTQQMSMAGAAPAVHKYLEIFTNLATAVPYMLVLEMSIPALSVFVGITAGTAIYFYMKILGHTLLLATVRAGCVSGACLIAFATIRRNMRENYFKEMERAKHHGPPLATQCDAS